MASRGRRLYARLQLSVSGERLLFLSRGVRVQIGLRRSQRPVPTDLSRRMQKRRMRGTAYLQMQTRIRPERTQGVCSRLRGRLLTWRVQRAGCMHL